MIVHDKKQEPHWAPGAADYLASLLQGDEVAIEWGGGGSSPWLLPKVKELHTIESDPRWTRTINAWCGDAENFTLHQHDQKSEDYVCCMEGKWGLDPVVWLIDGYNRIDCLKFVMGTAVEAREIIVLDDALDYAEHLLGKWREHEWKRFKQPHPYAGKKVVRPPYRNTVRAHYAATKETWIWQG